MTTARVLRVDSEVIRRGTSLYSVDTGEIYWFHGVEDGYVHLENVEGKVRAEREDFCRYITNEKLVIESQPPGRPDEE